MKYLLETYHQRIQVIRIKQWCANKADYTRSLTQTVSLF